MEGLELEDKALRQCHPRRCSHLHGSAAPRGAPAFTAPALVPAGRGHWFPAESPSLTPRHFKHANRRHIFPSMKGLKHKPLKAGSPAHPQLGQGTEGVGRVSCLRGEAGTHSFDLLP